jgi:RNA polymerase sigma factor (sigma-70 family)
MRVRDVDVLSWDRTTGVQMGLTAGELHPADVDPVGASRVTAGATRAGFEAFYRREYAAVVALAFALCGRGGAAEDLAQEAFLSTYRHWAKVADYDRPGAYVRHLVANLAVSYGRRRAAEGRALMGLAGRARSSVDDLEPPDAAFWRTVRSLPPRQAQCVALYYLEDRSAEEIAEILHCAVSTVRVHLHRGRLTLEERLRDGSAS